MEQLCLSRSNLKSIILFLKKLDKAETYGYNHSALVKWCTTKRRSWK